MVALLTPPQFLGLESVSQRTNNAEVGNQLFVWDVDVVVDFVWCTAWLVTLALVAR